jgi:hypothetical protein
MKTLISSIVLVLLTAHSVVFADTIRLKPKDFPGVVEEGIPVDKHIVLVENCRFLDDATDDDGTVYYFYMVDHNIHVKILITRKELVPIAELDQRTKEFVEDVKKEIEKDGGVDVLIARFSRQVRHGSLCGCCKISPAGHYRHVPGDETPSMTNFFNKNNVLYFQDEFHL